MSYVPGSVPPSRSPSPPPRRVPPLPANSAATAFGGGTRILPGHDDPVAQAFTRAAQLNILINHLSLPDAKGDPKTRQANCAKLALLRDETIRRAISPRLATDGGNRELIARSIVRAVDDAVVSPVFEELRDNV